MTINIKDQMRNLICTRFVGFGRVGRGLQTLKNSKKKEERQY
jgi:hypothetical protein